MVPTAPTDEICTIWFRELLMVPQMRGITDRFASAGVEDADAAAELLVGPVFHRWLLRSHAFERAWVTEHVVRVVRAVGVPTAGAGD